MNAVRHVLDVTPDLLARNDDAPAPGALLVLAGCPICNRRRRWALHQGRWAIEHLHGGDWTALPLPADGQEAGRVDVGALAAGMAEAVTA
jgi:hypothetical protein